MSMTADVAHNTSIGVGALIRNWKIITVLFPEIHVELNKLTEVTECSVIANITTTITLSEPSLHSVFLQPKTKYERTLCSWIVTKLQGQRVVMHGSVRFSWCSASNRVIGVHSQTDMMTPLMQILGDIEDFAMLFSNARITPGFDLVR
ncbi:hypothetical protein PHMEG_00023418 [Phytophthora megakarya]|uniref:Uncharacterized protein n=1 Tax=Phytophthora megakarya TaxID=4795 RepID=A0A225VHS0_9STRA|nr:hypothetical protein PHMEG_00023418 [Phytophthora megakarya]